MRFLLPLILLGLIAYNGLAQKATYNLHWEAEKCIVNMRLPKKELKEVFFDEGCNYHLTIAYCVKLYMASHFILAVNNQAAELEFLSISSDAEPNYITARFLLFGVEPQNIDANITIDAFLQQFPGFVNELVYVPPVGTEQLLPFDSASTKQLLRL